MGEFTQNLLKLTDFPFSYSLLTLIAQISGHEITAPLLLLMGFFATTLSICDPIGHIQRPIIKGRKLPEFKMLEASIYFENQIFSFCDIL
jgi:hypothetical protein